jgi:DNA-binding transcriptional LysR family regulator
LSVNKAFQGFKDFFQFDETQITKQILLHDGGLGVEAARSGQGIAMQRLSLALDLVESGELIYAQDYAFNEYSFYAVAPEHLFTLEKVQKFLSWLKPAMEQMQQRLIPYIAKIRD